MARYDPSVEEVKAAVKAARDALPTYVGEDSVERVRVEEVKRDGDDIIVGLSFLDEADPDVAERVFGQAFSPPRLERVFRRLRVRDGEVIEMESLDLDEQT